MTHVSSISLTQLNVIIPSQQATLRGGLRVSWTMDINSVKEANFCQIKNSACCLLCLLLSASLIETILKNLR